MCKQVDKKEGELGLQNLDRRQLSFILAAVVCLTTTQCECWKGCTHNDRLPLEVDVVDAHHLVGRKSNDRITTSICKSEL